MDYPARMRTDHVHHVRPSAECRHRIAVTHRLGIGREVGVYAVEFLRAALRDAKTGLDFIDQQQRPMPGTGVAQCF